MIAPHYTSGQAALRAATDPNTSSSKSNSNGDNTRLPLLAVTIPQTDGDGGSVLAEVDGASLRLVKNQDGHFIVVAMTPSCKLLRFGIDVGMELLSVNNVPTTTLPDEAAFFETLHGTTTTATTTSQKKQLLTTILAHPSPSSTKQYMPPPGTFVTAVIEKELQTTSVGALLVQQQQQPQADDANKKKKGTNSNTNTTSEYGKVMIQEIRPNTLATNTTLRAGMQLISINNTLCVNTKESAQQLRASTGRLTLLAQVATQVPAATAYHVTATMQVPTSSTDERGTLGLTLSDENCNSNNTVISIAKIDPKGPLATSKLRVGMQLVSVNNVECDTLAMAHALLAKAQLHQQQRLVTVLAKQTCLGVPPGTLLTATAIKDPLSKLGIMVGYNYVAGTTMPVIQFVQEGGLMARSSGNILLEPGMILHKVNNVPTKGLQTKEQVSQLLQKTSPQGTVTLLVEAPTSIVSGVCAGGQSVTPESTLLSLRTVAMIQKVPQQSLGWKLEQQQQIGGQRMVVTHLEDGGLAMTAGVRRGMSIFKVDNTVINCCYNATEAEEAITALIHKGLVGVPVTLLLQEEVPAMLTRSVVTGTIFKETKASSVGIRLRKHKGSVAIVGITEGSVSSATDLLGGMVFQSINNIDCSKKTPEQVAEILADGVGAITLLAKTPDCALSPASLASFVTATVSKSARLDDSDKSFTYEEGKVWVSEEGVKGLFHGSALRMGMEVISVNNTPCEILTPAGIKSLLKKSDEYLTIVAKRPLLPPGLLITEVLCRNDDSMPLGLDCAIANGKVVISNIKDGSLASTSRLLEGMEVFMVNNAGCSKLNAKSAMELLFKEAATGVITFVAGASSRDVPMSNRSFVTATLDKEKEKDRPVGITVNRNHYGQIVIAKIDEGSLASDTDLCEGMEILSIKNVSCQDKKALDVESLLINTEGSSSSSSSLMTILAERPPTPQGKVVIGSMVKKSVDMKVGVTMRQQNGMVLVKHIVPDSLSSTTDLDVGMWIKAINNKDCTDSNSKDVAEMLKAAISVITILAETTTETFEEASATPSPVADSGDEDSVGETAPTAAAPGSTDETAPAAADDDGSGDENASTTSEDGGGETTTAGDAGGETTKTTATATEDEIIEAAEC